MAPSAFQKILILTEAGKNIGFGHLARCLAVRDELKTKGVEAILIANLIEMPPPDSDVVDLDWIKDPSRLNSYNGVKLVLVDSYIATDLTYKHLQSLFSNVAVIDDYNRMVYSSSLVINPNIFFSQMDYSNQFAAVKGGRNYVILRKPFRQNLNLVSPKDQIENILITLGGSDFRKLLPRLIRFFENKKALSIKLIDPEGNTSTFAENIEVFGAQTASEMYSLMAEADIVISGCGQSLNELASIGKSVIGICLDIDQEPNEKAYLASGFLPEKISWNSPNLESLLEENIDHLSEKSVRIDLQSLGIDLVDRDGVSNLCNTLLSFADD